MSRAERVFTTDRRDNNILVTATSLPPGYDPPYTLEDDPLHVTFERIRSIIQEEC